MQRQNGKMWAVRILVARNLNVKPPGIAWAEMALRGNLHPNMYLRLEKASAKAVDLINAKGLKEMAEERAKAYL